jgi:protein-disulfide isomerase
MISMRNLLKCSAVLVLSFSLFAQTSANQPASQPAPQPAAAAAAPALPPGAPTLALAEAYFKRMFGYDSNLQVKVVNIGLSPIPELYEIAAVFTTPEGQQAGHWYISKDLKHAIAGDLLPFGVDPFEPERRELAKSAFGPTKGPADAKLLVVEFADLECPACKDAAPLMEKLRTDFPQARFVFQSFPLAQLHPWAARASSYLDCIARSNQGQAFTFIDVVFTHQKDIETDVRKTDAAGKTTIDNAAVTERLRYYAEMAGADAAKTQACAETPATAERITRSQLLGQSVGVTGTPTLFINGRRVGNPGAAQYEALKAVVAFESDQAAAGK